MVAVLLLMVVVVLLVVVVVVGIRAYADTQLHAFYISHKHTYTY